MHALQCGGRQAAAAAVQQRPRGGAAMQRQSAPPCRRSLRRRAGSSASRLVRRVAAPEAADRAAAAAEQQQQQHHEQQQQQPPVPRPSEVAASADAARARAVGCLVGGAAGASLGLTVEPERSFRLTRLFPEGLTDPWRFLVTPERPAPGDYAAVVAAARALALGALGGGNSGSGSGGSSGSSGGRNIGILLDELAGCYAPGGALRYTPYTALVLDALAAGTEPAALARLAGEYLDAGASRAASTASGRPERQPFGAGDFGAALRAAPLGVAVAGASGASVDDAALLEAVDAWTLWSHPNALGRDGAVGAAAAAAWLASCGGADAAGATPEALLDRLEALAATDDLKGKLALVRGCLAAVGQLPAIGGGDGSSGGSGGSGSGAGPTWREFWASEAWGRLVDAHSRAARHGFATLAPQALAAALLALATSWRDPRQAVVIAASLGGASASTAALTGMLAGALHGCAWVPDRWWDAMGEAEAERRVRDDAMRAGLALPLGLPLGGGGGGSGSGSGRSG